MSISRTAPHDSAPSAPEDAPDPAILRAERRLRLLAELAEIGMDIARALRARALMEEGRIAAAAAAGEFTIEVPGAPADAKGRDPAELFGPLTRAIRLTIVLEAKEDKALRDLKAGVRQEREEERVLTHAKARKTHLGQVRRAVLALAEAEIPMGDGRLEETYGDLEDYLEMEAAEFEWPGAEPSLRESVERICKSLSLTPDWSRWTGDGWLDDTPLPAPVTPCGRDAASLAPPLLLPAPQSPIRNGHDLQ